MRRTPLPVIAPWGKAALAFMGLMLVVAVVRDLRRGRFRMRDGTERTRLGDPVTFWGFIVITFAASIFCLGMALGLIVPKG